MDRPRLTRLAAALLLLGEPARALAQGAAQLQARARAQAAPAPADKPPLEAKREELALRLHQWGNVLFKSSERRPAWFKAVQDGVDAARTEPELADLDACFYKLRDSKPGPVAVPADARCPRAVVEAAASGATVEPPPDPFAALRERQAKRERDTLAGAQRTADRLGSSARDPGATPFSQRWSGAERATGPEADRLAAGLKKRAASLVPPPAAESDDSFIDKAKDVMLAAVEAGRKAAKGVVDLMSKPEPPTPLQLEQQRVLTVFVGLGPFVSLQAPERARELRDLLARVNAAKDQAELLEAENALRALKSAVMDGLRAKAKGRELQTLAGVPRKATLSMPQPGRLVAQSAPEASAKEWEQYLLFQLPLDAELALGTKFPVAAIDRGGTQALVLRGEDYGIDKEAKAKATELARLEGEARKAAQAVLDAQGALERGEKDVEAAKIAKEQREASAAAAAQEAERARLAAGEAAEAADRARAEAEAAARDAASKRDASAEQIRQALLGAGEIDLEITFGYNSARLDPKALPQLAELARALGSEELKSLAILVNGHTDAKGSAPYNQALSQRRAEAVKQHLVAQHQIAAERLTAQGFGFSKLKDPEHPLSEKNRRVQIAVKRDEQETAARRSELEAQAAEQQAALEERSAELAQKAAEASQAKAAALQAKLDAAAAAARAQAEARSAGAALTAAERALPALKAAIPAAQKAKADAEGSIERLRPLFEKDKENSEGVLYVRDFRAYHYSWDGAPPQLSERVAKTLIEGFRGHGLNGRAANAILERPNEATGRTLALDIAGEMERREAAKSNWDSFKEGASEMFTFLQGRWVDVIGRVGRGQQFVVSDPVSETAGLRPKAMPVETITPQELAKLYPKTQASTGPAVDEAAAHPDPGVEPQKDPQGGAEAEEAAAAREQARQEAEIALNAKRVAEEAAAARAAADKARREAREAADKARAKKASAAQIRDALTRRAAAPSIDLEVYFDYDSARVTAQAIPQLVELGNALAAPELRGFSFFIYGHTDARGGAAYNLELSQRRAEAVRQYLIASFHFPAERLLAKGFGFSQLKDPAHPSADQNRRVQVGLIRD